MEIEYYATEPVLCCQYKPEFEELLRLFRILNPSQILEVGTHYGGTLYQWIKNSDIYSLIIAVDNQHINLDKYKDWKEDTQLVVPIKGDSQDEEIISRVKKYSPYDFIFIDADHSYDGVKRDWESYRGMTSPDRNSLVVFHDILWHPHAEVYKLWREIKGDYEHYEFVSHPDQDGCGIGVLIIEREK